MNVQVIREYEAEAEALAAIFNARIEARALELLELLRRDFPGLTGFCSGMGSYSLIGEAWVHDPDSDCKEDREGWETSADMLLDSATRGKFCFEYRDLTEKNLPLLQELAEILEYTMLPENKFISPLHFKVEEGE